jgi:hypothetical protein
MEAIAMLLANRFQSFQVGDSSLFISSNHLCCSVASMVNAHPRDAGPNADKGGFVKELMQNGLI